MDGLPRNLRYLCDSKGSVSHVCRATGVNRQQFNKYLAGQHRPSAANLRRIAQYFGVAPPMLEMPHEQFVSLMDGNSHRVLDELRSAPKAMDFLDHAVRGDGAQGGDLPGRYDRYHFSSIYPGRILRAAFCIYRHGSLLMHYYVERFPAYDTPGKADYVFKYHGMTMPLAGRIFAIDYESAQRNELTMSIFASQDRSSRRYLFGVTNGIAATMLRQPFSTRVVLQYRGEGLLQREDLKRSTVLDRNNPQIPFEVREFLTSKEDMIIL